MSSLLKPRACASGFQHIAYDAKQSNPYQVKVQLYRSARFSTLYEAKSDLLNYLKTVSVTLMQSGRTRSQTTPCAVNKWHPRSKVDKCTPAKRGKPRSTKKRVKKRVKKRGMNPSAKLKTTKKPDSNLSNLSPQPSLSSPLSSVPADSWMQKPEVHFSDDVHLFGARILMKRKGIMKKAVIKAWLPYAPAPFVIVFDDEPDKHFFEDLRKKNPNDWREIPWEGDLEETSEYRPICPRCCIVLEKGAAAWTRCHGCGTPEPGATSFAPGKRVRVYDPFRNIETSYVDDDDDDI